MKISHSSDGRGRVLDLEIMSRSKKFSPPNPPHRHHYIPAFYLSRWALGKDGRLCQYSKPYGRVVPNRRHPEATGFSENLYELKGLESDQANAVETKFFKPVDSAASDALFLMEKEHNRANWDSRRRTGWAIFLYSLLLRSPEDVSALKEVWRNMIDADGLREWEERYQEIKNPGDAPTFREHMNNQPPDLFDRSAMQALVGVIDSSKVARAIYNMHWHVIETSDADFDFLTSDRPLIRTNGLLAEGGHLALPIGPKKLFIAAKNQAYLQPILSMPHRQLVRECNRQICQFAVKFVYGIDDAQLTYVAKHFSTKKQPRLINSLLANRLNLSPRK